MAVLRQTVWLQGDPRFPRSCAWIHGKYACLLGPKPVSPLPCRLSAPWRIMQAKPFYAHAYRAEVDMDQLHSLLDHL